MKVHFFKYLLLTVTAILPLVAQATPIVHRTDIIADGERTHFAGFESITDRVSYDMTHVEDGIVVQNVGDYLVWTEHWFRSGFEGARGWYPSGSYSGYNLITRQDGADFQSIGMLVGSGYGGYCNWDYDTCDGVAAALSLHYELRKDGSLVDAGVLSHHSNARYLGFSGGGFDEVRVWDQNIWYAQGGTALMLDAIELAGEATAVPEPNTAVLLLGALGLMGAARRRRS